MSEVKVNKVTPRSGTTLTIGDSGDTTNIVGTLQNNGSELVGDISSVVAGTGSVSYTHLTLPTIYSV